MICTRIVEGEATEMPCKGEAVLEGLCWKCFWVEKPERRGELPPRVKTVKPRAEQKETPWAKKVLGIFTPWRTRKEWPVGSVLLRRNNNGLFRHRFRDDLIKCGLGTGTGDYVGFKSIVITQAMVGQRFAQFASVEAKRDGKDFEEWQQKWHDMLLLNGALSFRLAPETKDSVLRVLESK